MQMCVPGNLPGAFQRHLHRLHVYVPEEQCALNTEKPKFVLQCLRHSSPGFLNDAFAQFNNLFSGSFDISSQFIQ